ncbi:MAG: cupin-like domain-containing protein [Flavobacteriales bacterium]|nr:cupin-like domain-containing protein [Flavobacteriales bacterium]
MNKGNVLRVDRHATIGQKELLNEYVNNNKPVIITDSAKQWPAVGKWTPEFFKKNYPKVSREEW